MTEVGAYEAKTNLPSLLAAVERGESVTITRHGKPIARLVPATRGGLDALSIREGLRAVRAAALPGPETIAEMKAEGRR